MDLLHLISPAPDPTDSRENKPSILVSWWCTVYAVTIILFRICGRYIRTERVYAEDGIMLLAIIPLFIRMALVHVILLYGTNNTVVTGLTAEDIHHRELGSRLVLASRIMYAVCLWAIKYSVSMFLRTLTESVWQRSHQKLLRYLHIFLAVTFVATVISDLAACQPFSHYWQVIPDPGPKCRQGYAQLLTMGIMNIITNLTLVAFPIPMIMRSRLSQKRKFGIILRMALPLFGIIVTLYQIPKVISHHGAQPFRTLVASFDILISTAAANAVVLGSLLQDRGYKKAKYKHGVTELDGFARRPSAPGHTLRDTWGSDEDLMRGDAEGKVVVIGMDELPIQGVEEPAKAKLSEIRVASTWEVKVVERSVATNET